MIVMQKVSRTGWTINRGTIFFEIDKRSNGVRLMGKVRKENKPIKQIPRSLASAMASAVGFAWSTVTFLYKKIRSKLRRKKA